MGNKISRRRIVVDERYTHPQGLYAQWDVNQKKLRQLILKAKLAPCYPGVEDGSVELEECPICFLSYPSLNRSKCCSKSICTECYLQIKSPSYVQQPQCPFCKTPNYNVEYRGAKTNKEKGIEIAEEQKVIEAKIRMRQKEVQEEEQKIHAREHDLRGADGGLAQGESSQLQPLESSRMEEQHAPGIPNTIGWIHNLNQRSLVDSECEAGQSRNAMEDISETGSRDSFLAHTVAPAHILARNSSRAEDYVNMDLEEMMYAEAIWRSIQDQNLGLPNSGLARQTATSIFDSDRNSSELLDDDGDNFEDDNDDDDDDDGGGGNMRLVQRRTSGRGEGGLVGAVSTLAESHAKEEMRVRASLPTMAHFQAIQNTPERIDDGVAADPTYSEVDMETTRKSLAWTRRCHLQPRLDPSNNSWEEVSLVGVGGSASEWAPDHSSEAVEVGTSFSSSVPSASDIPWEAHSSDSHLHDTSSSAIAIPESFEEQIALAIALSLDPAQAKRRRM